VYSDLAATITVHVEAEPRHTWLAYRVMRLVRLGSNDEDASRAELHAPKIGACVSPVPLSALSKYRPFMHHPYKDDHRDHPG
jgi:hypothetical protein